MLRLLLLAVPRSTAPLSLRQAARRRALLVRTLLLQGTREHACRWRALLVMASSLVPVLRPLVRLSLVRVTGGAGAAPSRAKNPEGPLARSGEHDNDESTLQYEAVGTP